MDRNTHTIATSPSGHGRVSELLICLLVLVLTGEGCRKDPELPMPEDGLCKEFWEWHATGDDTLYFGESSSSYTFILNGLPGYQGDCRIGLGFSEQDMNPGPGTYYAQEVMLSCRSIDSTALIGRSLPGTSCPDTWNPGDMVNPSMYSYWYFPLYWNYPDYCPDNNPVWYVGFVKILGNRKHAGYIKVNHLISPTRYVIDHVRLNKCPDRPIVID